MLHLQAVIHGLAAAIASVGFFALAGLVFLPTRWAAAVPVSTPVVGLACYLIACWMAVNHRDMPLRYVIPVFTGAVFILAVVRARTVRSVVTTMLVETTARRAAVAAVGLYLVAYLTLIPPDPSAFLPLGPARNLELVTHARYARHLFELGTPHDLELAPFAFRRSPAASFLLAWQSVLFRGDALAAAIPALCGMAAAFGCATICVLRRAGVRYAVSLAIACALVAGALSRWVLAAYGLPGLLAATAVEVAVAAGFSATPPRTRPPVAAAVCASALVLFFAEALSPGRLAAGVQAAVRVFTTVPPHVAMGWPASLARVRSDDVIDGAFLILPITALMWAAVSALAARTVPIDRSRWAEQDRRLARAIACYALASLAVGNVAVDLVRDPRAARVTAAWRQMEALNSLPFKGLTLKMDDIFSVPTAVALYTLPFKRAIVIGPDIQDADLEFEAVSTQLPLFIEDFGCAGAGHDNTFAVGNVGCLMLAPPSPTLGTRYPFNQRFPFMSYDAMSARTPQGRYNTRHTVPLKVTVDPQRAQLDHPVYFNLLLDPQIPQAGNPRAVGMRWGADHRATLTFDRPTWISLPLGPEDWSGNRMWTTVVTITFPDASSPTLFQLLSLTERPEGTLVAGQ